jgi:hypothetical protein
VAEETAGSNRLVADVAAKHWPCWHTASSAAGSRSPVDEGPTSTQALGIDGTRRRTVRWNLEHAADRRRGGRSDRADHSFFDADPARAGATPRAGAGLVRVLRGRRLAEHVPQFGDQVEG